MKRHQIVALLCLIFGGLLAYARFDSGDIGGAIRTGIIFALFGIFMSFSGRMQPRFRSLGLNLIVLTGLGILTYRDFMSGDIVSGIILIALTIAVILQLLTIIREHTPR